MDIFAFLVSGFNFALMCHYSMGPEFVKEKVMLYGLGAGVTLLSGLSIRFKR